MIITRHSKPSALELFPRGTICKTLKSFKDLYEAYVQINNDENYPNWYFVGMFDQENEGLLNIEAERILEEHAKSMQPTPQIIDNEKSLL